MVTQTPVKNQSTFPAMCATKIFAPKPNYPDMKGNHTKKGLNAVTAERHSVGDTFYPSTSKCTQTKMQVEMTESTVKTITLTRKKSHSVATNAMLNTLPQENCWIMPRPNILVPVVRKMRHPVQTTSAVPAESLLFPLLH